MTKLKFYSLSVMIFFLLFPSLRSSAESLQYVGFSEPSLKLKKFAISSESGLIGEDGRDYSLALRRCESNSKWKCLLLPNKGVIFALPNRKLVVKEKWLFSGYEFTLDDCEDTTAGNVYLISAKLRTVFTSEDDYVGDHRQSIQYLYDEEKGILGWVFEKMISKDGSILEKEVWVNANVSEGFSSWYSRLPVSTVLSEKAERKLENKDLTYKEFVNLYLGWPASEKEIRDSP
ncbi:hypothetical protein [Teredinibacter sp. KSP-S5-2]|uniref:hypothetical protein n=1 Tax=Teredinibacter sp. KSP-S5-2 TaxID=3034506 RepID=UPI0029351892|nr:hypothetical protein [Teredinibacter sp. KSP-S5-2]WNO10744.1 hypothetical protein P5V12_06100 [Teredinibacter sp. KSP-S5-2]